jgi:chitin synthase
MKSKFPDSFPIAKQSSVPSQFNPLDNIQELEQARRNSFKLSRNFSENKPKPNSKEAAQPLKIKRWISNNSTRSNKLTRLRSHPHQPLINQQDGEKIGIWKLCSWLLTCCFPPYILKCFGYANSNVQQAWREKVALVTIIFFLCFLVGFLTFGIQQALCGSQANISMIRVGSLTENEVVINGYVYDFRKFDHPGVDVGKYKHPEGFKLDDSSIDAGTKDLSLLFQSIDRNNPGVCSGVLTIENENTDQPTRYFPCVAIDYYSSNTIEGSATDPACHFGLAFKSSKNLPKVGDMYYTWKDIKRRENQLIVVGSHVIDLSRLKWLRGTVSMSVVLAELMDLDKPYVGTDVSFYLRNLHPNVSQCIISLLRVGMLDTRTPGCIASDVIMWLSLFVIIGVVVAKFSLALFFGWVVSWRLGALNERTYKDRLLRFQEIESWTEEDQFLSSQPSSTSDIPSNMPNMTTYPLNDANRVSKYSLGALSSEFGKTKRFFKNKLREQVTLEPMNIEHSLGFQISYSIQLVTCYSEGYEGIKSTLDSLANTDYPNSHQLLFVVADGIIKGAGNKESTPDICLSLMKDYVIPPEQVKPHQYVAIGEKSKRENMAKVYAGYYYQTNPPKPSTADPELASAAPSHFRGRVPMILVVKCGTNDEQSLPKPGNRGKRDSQMIIMSFLQKVMFNDRMSELEGEMFNAIWNVAKVPPDVYETILMVDADTKVYPDSLTRMIACFSRDPKVMGLCGETKIANKTQSWVTMIQVFEYYISHHLSKAFESIFGGVTCLPGCFCAYRIKVRKGVQDDWVPVLVNPDVINQYSENVVQTLHQKNLLLLGEDRFLTTLMLRTFPTRKLIFVPQAVCKTIVPDTFSVLLSQRRRWINSTVHNLLELMITRELCGTFCFSMQFVIFMELVGTVVLPAAIIFTLYLIGVAIFIPPVPVIPLILLGVILGLPAILIFMTSRRLSYVVWMLIYLISLPIWNFVLPVYAFWHFDDFSWGQTRMVDGDKGKDSHGGNEKDEAFDTSSIVMKRWVEYEREKRKKITLALTQYGSNLVLPSVLLDSSSPDKKFINTDTTLAYFTSLQTLINNDSNTSLDEPEKYKLDSLGYLAPVTLKNLASLMNSNHMSWFNSEAELSRPATCYSQSALDHTQDVSQMPWRSPGNGPYRKKSQNNLSKASHFMTEDSLLIAPTTSNVKHIESDINQSAPIFDPNYTSKSNNI